MRIVRLLAASLLAVLVGLALVPQTSAAPAPQIAAPMHVGPTYPQFWYPGAGNIISICVNNRSSFAAQTATERWDVASNLNLYYEPGPTGCDTWPNNHRIDIRDGSDAHCVYFFVDADANGFYTRAIMYMSTAPSQADCWITQIRKNHFASKGLGVMLGLVVFDNPGPDLHVMNAASQDTISWPQPYDLYTFDVKYI